MPIVETRLNLKGVIGGRRVGGKGISLAKIGIDAVLISVIEPGEARAFASHVTDFDGGASRDLLLDIEIPFTGVGRGQIMSCSENREWAARHGRKNGAGGSSGPGGLIECERENRLRTEGVRRDACHGGEISDHQILRDVIVIDTVSGADHGVLERAPRDGESRCEIVQVALVSAAQAVSTYPCELRSSRERAGEIKQQVIFFADRAEIFPAKPVSDSEIRAHAEFVLSEERQAIVVSSALRVADVAFGEFDVSEIEIFERVSYWVGVKTRGANLDEAAPEVIVERADPRPPVFPAEFHRVRTFNPGEIIEDLIILADARSRNAKSSSAEIFDVPVKIDFW